MFYRNWRIIHWLFRKPSYCIRHFISTLNLTLPVNTAIFSVFEKNGSKLKSSVDSEERKSQFIFVYPIWLFVIKTAIVLYYNVYVFNLFNLTLILPENINTSLFYNYSVFYLLNLTITQCENMSKVLFYTHFVFYLLNLTITQPENINTLVSEH